MALQLCPGTWIPFGDCGITYLLFPFIGAGSVFNDESIIAFAGLWDETRPDDAPEDVAGSFTIITTSADKVIAPLHHRMPVILARNEEDLWLASDVEEAEAVQSLLDPFPGSRIDAFPVSTRVNNVRNNDESLVEPLEIERDPEQESLF